MRTEETQHIVGILDTQTYTFPHLLRSCLPRLDSGRHSEAAPSQSIVSRSKNIRPKINVQLRAF